MEVSEQLTGFELETLLFWTVSNLQRPFREDFSLQKSGIIAEKGSQIFGRRFVGLDGLRKRRLFSFQKGRWSQRLYLKAGAIMLRPYFLCTGGVT